jgi:hypothetical protein
MTSDDTLARLLAELNDIFERRSLTAAEQNKVLQVVLAFVEAWQRRDSVDVQSITDPRVWARAAMESPEMLRLLNDRDFGENTVGAWLRDAIAAERTRGTNVVDIETRRKRDE